MTVFIDASFLIALFNLEDEFHLKAKTIADKLDKDKARLVTSNIVLAESANFVFRFKGPAVCKRFLLTFKQSGIEEMFLTKDIFDLGYKYLLSMKTKRSFNLFDCLHLAAMKMLKIKTIASFDRAFQKEAEIAS